MRIAGGSDRCRVVHQSTTWRCVAIGGAGGGPIGPAVVPALLDGVRRQLPVGVASGGGGEGLFGCEVAQFELDVVVAVAHDVGVVGFASSGHADVQRRRRGAWGDHDVSALHGATLGASDRGRIGQHDVVGDVAGRQGGTRRPGCVADLEGAVGVEAGDGPHVSVEDALAIGGQELAGVAAGLDRVTDVDPGAVGGIRDVLTEYIRRPSGAAGSGC